MNNPYQQTVSRFLRTTLWLLCLLTVSQLAHAQSPVRYVIKGSVVDNAGQPLPGATLLLAGTTIGTNSDASGTYTLAATVKPGPATVVISAIGYETVRQPITLGSAEAVTVNVSLAESVNNLNDLVVVGSTIQTSRRELGNAITTIKAQDLVQSGSGGLLNSLQGKVPGAQITQNSGDPAGSISIRLRGIKSLSGSSDPLYVIDGVIVSNQSANVSQLAASADGGIGAANPGQNRLADINPNDIETLNVINGAAAAAQYGSRAANGVVLITTKRGKAGTPRITFSTSFNTNELRKGVPVNLVNKTFGNTQQRLYTITAFNTPAAQAGAVALNPATTFAPIFRDGTINQLASNVVDGVTRYNYFDQIFQTGTGTDNSLSISGGTDKTQYVVSFGHMTNQGIIKGTDFTRYSLRARVDQRLTNWAKLSAGLSYINSFANEKANGNVFYSPINSINIVNNIYDITQRDGSGNLKAVEGPRVNPLSTIEDMKFTQSINRTISDVQLNLTPFKGLTVDYILGVDTYGQVGQNYIRPYPYVAQASLGANLYPGGFAAVANNAVFQVNSDINVGYERLLTSDLKLNAIVGYNYQFFRSDYQTASGQNLSPFIETVRGAASTTVLADYSLDRFNLSGYFAQATIGYKNLAFLTGAVRRDQSSKFSPEVTNQTYPKLSGSLVLSDFGFWKNSGLGRVVNAVKLRTSYGEAGNLSGVGSYSRFYQFSPVAYLGRNTLLPGAQLANPLVRPERMAELEGGLDLSFFGDRVNLGVTMYNQQIKDLVVNRVLAPSSGGSSIVNNVGTMENRGVEIMLGFSPVRTKDFQWDITAIYNQNRNKILSLGSPVITIDNSAGAPVTLLTGQPAGVFFGSAFARRPDGTLIMTSSGFPQAERADVAQKAGSLDFVPARTSDGQVLVAGKTTANVIIGNPNPAWTGSLSSNLKYKRLGFHVLVDAVQGLQVFNADKRTRQGVGLGDFAAKELTGELQRGYIYAIYTTLEWRMDDGSYTKLREVGLNYDLPPLVKGLRNLNIALIGRNLYSWDKYTGFDPETNAGGANDLLRGVDFGNVPIPRTYQVKLTASF